LNYLEISQHNGFHVSEVICLENLIKICNINARFCFRLIGPINPKTPIQSMKIMIFSLRIIGLFPPDTDDKWTQRLYAVYATIFRLMFLHIFSSFQAVFFLQISNLKDVADALFMFMTEISLMYKTEIYFRNRFRFKAAVQKLDSELFRPQGDEEEA
jgi:hypothetical protein